MRRLAAIVFVSFWLVAPSMARADLRVPGVRPRPPVPRPEKADLAPVTLTVEIDESVKQPTLQIPRKLLASWTDGKAAPVAPRRGAALPALHTIFAGLALSLSVVCGGLWIVRHRGRSRTTRLALILGVTALLGIGGALFANLPPVIPPAPLAAKKFNLEKTNVVIVENGTTVKLLLSPKDAAQFATEVRVPLPRPRK